MCARYYGDVERVVRIDRAYMVAAAAARDFNDELTVIMSSLEGVLEHLEDGHPALPLLSDLQGAAQRCIWKSAGLLEFSARRGVPPVVARLEQLLGK
jgi:glucan phosphorylase